MGRARQVRNRRTNTGAAGAAGKRKQADAGIRCRQSGMQESGGQDWNCGIGESDGRNDGNRNGQWHNLRHNHMILYWNCHIRHVEPCLNLRMTDGMTERAMPQSATEEQTAFFPAGRQTRAKASSQSRQGRDRGGGMRPPRRGWDVFRLPFPEK